MIHYWFTYRLATIIYYLNDVEGGGETAFPVADKKNFDEKVRRTLFFITHFSCNVMFTLLKPFFFYFIFLINLNLKNKFKIQI